MLDPKEVEIELCKALAAGVFYTSKDFMVIWLKIKEEEKIEEKANVRVIRKNKFVWKWIVDSLKQWIEEVKSLEGPVECWIKFKWNVIIEMWDVLEIYKTEIHK